MRANKLIAALACASLAGCATLTGPAASSSQKVATVCATVAQGVRVLADPNVAPKLSATVVESIGAALTITTPICTAPASPTLAQAKMLELENAAMVISTLATTYQTPTEATP